MTTMFNTKQDIEVEQAGGFFCEGCLVGKPANEQSDDPRYCHSCCAFLQDEAELLPSKHKRPGWEPSPKPPEALPAVKEVVAKLADKGMTPVGGVLQQLPHPGGRPIKAGGVHRATKWRRKQKEAQGALC